MDYSELKETIQINIKLINNTTITTQVQPQKTKVSEVIQKEFPEELLANKKVRLIYNGAILDEKKYLSEYKVQDDWFLHAQVSNKPASTAASPEPNPASVPADNQQFQDEELNNLQVQYINAMLELQQAQRHVDAQQSPMGNGRDFFLGCVLGFFFHIFMWLCLFHRRVSQRMKAGIMVGVFCFCMYFAFGNTHSTAIRRTN